MTFRYSRGLLLGIKICFQSENSIDFEIVIDLAA